MHPRSIPDNEHVADPRDAGDAPPRYGASTGRRRGGALPWPKTSRPRAPTSANNAPALSTTSIAAPSEAAPRTDPLSSSSTVAAMATLTAPTITSEVNVTPDAAPAISGGTAAWVATLASAQPRPRPTPVTRNTGV